MTVTRTILSGVPQTAGRPVAALAVCLALTLQCFAEDWTRFRGPNGSGQSEADGIPVTWTAKDYNWRVKLPGIGYSSPIISGDRLYVTSAINDDATRIIRCLNTADGSLVWEKALASSKHHVHNFNCFASSSPVVDSRHVYMAWATPERYLVAALDKHTGAEVWRQDLGPFVAEHGFGASPIVWNDLLIVPNEQDGPCSIVALDCRTGQVRWKTERRTARTAYATPVIYQGEGPPQLILASMAHGVYSLDPSTGKPNWELPVFQWRVVGSPTIAAGLIIASCGEGGGGKRTVAIRPGEPSKGIPPKLEYEFEGSLPYVPVPVAYGDLLFLWSDSGVVTCADVHTGKIHWRQRVGGKFFGSPVRVRDKLYCMSREGLMYVLAAAKDFKLLAKIDLEEPSNATPAVADGVMYLRTNSHLMSLGGNKANAASR
jgi:outer membrane protein assembly factor BamB